MRRDAAEVFLANLPDEQVQRAQASRSAFEASMAVWEQSRAIITPFFDARYDGRVLEIAHDQPIGKYLQEKIGDYLFKPRGLPHGFRSMELKAETRTTGNFFFETWSNRGFSRGWTYYCRADYLLMHFLDSDMLYVMNWRKARYWFHGFASPDFGRKLNRDRYQAIKPGARQANETIGKQVPIEDVANEVGLVIFKPLADPLGQRPEFRPMRQQNLPYLHELDGRAP
jgi:hypothetical protein